MPVRLRITFLFTLLVFVILSLLCSGVYYFSYTARIKTIKTRLTNRAITTASFLSQEEIFDQKLVQQIDSLTTISLKNKVVEAYDHQDKIIYKYSDVDGDTLKITPAMLNKARVNGSFYFLQGNKEAVAYYYTDNNSRITIISAAEDVEAKENLAGLENILYLSFFVANIFVLLTGYFFSGGLLQPIKKITEDVAEISAQNLARRIKHGSTKDEWYYLIGTLNQLLNRLQKSFELQRRFISNASHEMSTPLTIISSQIEVTLQKPRDTAEYQKVMRSIYQDVQHMGKLTQTLLEFAKASGNAGGLDINLIRIDEIILRLPSEVAKIDAAYSVTLQFAKLPEEEEKLLVYGNEALLLTAIKNVVVNACKYSGDQHAEINLHSEKDFLFISISDNGDGIPDNELENIFQPFYRVDESRAAGGFGLGLSLAERIIKLHKGNLKVTSENGKGTTFAIELPVAHQLQIS